MAKDIERGAESTSSGSPQFSELEPTKSIVDNKSLALEKLEKDEINQEILQETIQGIIPDPSRAPEDYLVTFEGREHLNPQTWSVSYKWFMTFFSGFFYLNATFASSAPSNIITDMMAHYHFSQEVGILTIAVFVAGYCVGPLFWGPMSERMGRRPILIYSFIVYLGFTIGTAFAPNTGALIVFRFLSGCFAGSSVPISGAVIADIWEADTRGNAVAIFSVVPFAGPALAPVVSGFIHVSGIDFRWVFYILSIFVGVCDILLILFLPETHHGTILSKEAKRLRKESGDDRWHSSLEVTLKETGGARHFLHTTMLKPVIMLIEEPMLAILSVYMAFIYGIIYLFFEAFPLIFEGQHGLNAGKAGLVFIALPVGGTVGVITYIYFYNRPYVKLCREMDVVPPEARLSPLFIASPLYAACIFWLGFTSYPSISIWCPIMAIGCNGIFVSLVFLGSFNYIIDTYFINAASAISIATVIRSAFGAGFPLFTTQMYKKLSIPGAMGLVGGLAVLFVPFPFIFYKYGKTIRSWSKNAYVV